MTSYLQLILHAIVGDPTKWAYDFRAEARLAIFIGGFSLLFAGLVTFAAAMKASSLVSIPVIISSVWGIFMPANVFPLILMLATLKLACSIFLVKLAVVKKMSGATGSG